MANLEVSFEDQLIADGGRIYEPQENQSLEVLWDPVKRYPYYTLKVRNLRNGELYIYRINIFDHNEGDDLVPEAEYFNDGDYLVSLYGQKSKIDPDQAEQNQGQLKELQKTHFSVGEASYGCGCQAGGQVYGQRKTALARVDEYEPSQPSDLDYEPISTSPKRHRSDIIVDKRLNPQQRKYCSCLLGAGQRQSPVCLTEKRYFQRLGGRMCYSVPALCHASVKTGAVECFTHYLFDKATDGELVTAALQHKMPLPRSWNGKSLPDEDRETLRRKLKAKQKALKGSKQ